jgi:ABC-2 type transport system permease protein
MTVAAAGAGRGRHPEGWGGFRLVPALLRARLRMVVNGALRGGRERRGWTLVLTVAAVGAMSAGYRVASGVLSVSDPDPAGLEPIVAGLCGMVAGFTAVTAITFALSAFYFARDLEPLLASPLPPRSVLLTKLCVQLATGLAIGTFLAGAPIAAYLVRHGNLVALPWIGLCTLALAMYALAAGTALTVVVVRLLPARRVRDAGGLVVTAAVFGITGFNLAVRGPGVFTSTPGLLDPNRQSGATDAAWLPTGWAARSLTASLRGDLGASLLWGLPMIVGAIVLLVLLARVLEAPFLTGFQRSLESGRGRRRRVSARTVVTGRGRRPVWLAIAHKDLRETLRDAGQLGQLVLPLALFAVYIASPTNIGVNRTAEVPSWFGTLLTAGFASLFAASGVGLRGVGSEGRRLWMLRVAPIDVREVLAAKYASGAAIAVALGLLLIVVGAFRLQLGLLEGCLVALLMSVIVAGLVGLAVGMGAIRPRLDWSDPRRSVGIGTSLAFLGVGSVYLGAAFLLLALPYARPEPGVVAIVVADLTVVVMAALVAVVSLTIGAARLRTLEF